MPTNILYSQPALFNTIVVIFNREHNFAFLNISVFTYHFVFTSNKTHMSRYENNLKLFKRTLLKRGLSRTRGT